MGLYPEDILKVRSAARAASGLPTESCQREGRPHHDQPVEVLRPVQRSYATTPSIAFRTAPSTLSK